MCLNPPIVKPAKGLGRVSTIARLAPQQSVLIPHTVDRLVFDARLLTKVYSIAVHPSSAYSGKKKKKCPVTEREEACDAADI